MAAETATTKLYVVRWSVTMEGVENDILTSGVDYVRAVDEDAAAESQRADLEHKFAGYPYPDEIHVNIGSVEISKNDPALYSRSLL